MGLDDKNVKVISQHGESALVEWMERGKTKRVVLPMAEVSDGQVSKQSLEEGMSYGIPFEDHIETRPFSKSALAEGLRRNGIWTTEDLRLKAARAMRVFNHIAVQVLFKMLKSIEKEKSA